MKRLIYLLIILTIFTSCGKEDSYKTYPFIKPQQVEYPVMAMDTVCMSCIINRVLGADSVDFSFISNFRLSYKYYHGESFVREALTLNRDAHYLRPFFDMIKRTLPSNPSELLRNENVVLNRGDSLEARYEVWADNNNNAMARVYINTHNPSTSEIYWYKQPVPEGYCKASVILYVDGLEYQQSSNCE